MKHIPVLLNEVIDNLNIKKDGIYVDGTIGGAGHSKVILSKLENGLLYGFDQDTYAIKKANENLEKYSNKLIIHDNFKNMKQRLNELGINKVDGILLDLGLSSFQIDDKTRGFSYMGSNLLDMRMNKKEEIDATYILNNYDINELTNIFKTYGEERNAYKIAREIINNRPINKTDELVNITDKINFKEKGHSAKRVFQALRIEVNDELNVLKEVLEDSLSLLNKDGRIVVISFHSLEDRIVKQFFNKHSKHNLPKSIDIRFLDKPPLSLITKKGLMPSPLEIENNPRSKSAILRCASKN